MTKPVSLSIIIPTLYQDNYYEDVVRNIFDVCDVPFEIITIENKLVNEAWNEGVEKAKGEYICIINDDIIIEPGTFKKMIGLLKYHTISCPYFSKGDNNQKIYSSTGKKIIGFCFMFKREDKDKLFPIPSDLKLRYGDDWLFNRCNADMGLGGKIHHWESKTILSPEQKDKCAKIIEWDTYAWEGFYKLI